MHPPRKSFVLKHAAPAWRTVSLPDVASGADALFELLRGMRASACDGPKLPQAGSITQSKRRFKSKQQAEIAGTAVQSPLRAGLREGRDGCAVRQVGGGPVAQRQQGPPLLGETQRPAGTNRKA